MFWDSADKCMLATYWKLHCNLIYEENSVQSGFVLMFIVFCLLVK